MTAFSVVVLAGMIAFLVKSRANYCALPELTSTRSSAPDATVIIPARDEESQIARCVASFPAPVIVVDDASADSTAAAARAAGATVIDAPPLPTGALGKPNACAAGARRASTKWLLFADADTWYDRDFLAIAVAFAERESLDILTVFLRQQRQCWAERVILPYAFALYFCGVSARAVNSPDSSESLANGQCLLIRRDAYDRIGGHGAVSGSVIEDVAMARLARRYRLRLRVVRAEGLGSVRMYESFSAIWRGFEKNSFRFLRANPRTGAQVIAASVALTSWLPALLLAPWPLAVGIALAPSILLKPWYGSWRDALTAPLAIYLFQFIALAGMFNTIAGRTTIWKRRHV